MLKLDIFNKEIQSSDQRFDTVNIFTSGEQVNFDSRPTVNGTGIFLSGDNGYLPSNCVLGDTNLVTITQSNNAPEQTVDVVSDGVQLTRGSYGVLYNPLEDSEGAENPYNTEWNDDGWSDLSNINGRTYVNLLDTAGYENFGNAVIGTELIMHDTSTDKYHKVLFSAWQQGGGHSPDYRGFSYARTELDYKQEVSGLVNFTTRPTVNGTGVLLNGDFNIVAPQTGDFILKQSYQGWFYGTDIAKDNTMSKWDGIQSSDYNEQFSLQFLGGTINGQIIPKSNFLIGTGTTVNADTIYYRDDDYGMQPANYVDFINGIFESYGLSSRIYGQNSSSRFIINYATTEQFEFLFVETCNVGYLNNPQYYQIGTINPYNIYDKINNETTLDMYGFRFWSDL